jgi:hypothetical protein
MSFLELLPRKAVRIEEDAKQKQLNTLKSDLKEAFEDVKLNRTTKTNKTIRLDS